MTDDGQRELFRFVFRAAEGMRDICEKLFQALSNRRRRRFTTHNEDGTFGAVDDLAGDVAHDVSPQ